MEGLALAEDSTLSASDQPGPTETGEPIERLSHGPHSPSAVGRVVFVLALLILSACNQGPPYAFRLMIPPKGLAAKIGSYVPYWFWEEWATFETFGTCEESRKKVVEGASPDANGQWPSAHVSSSGRTVVIPRSWTGGAEPTREARAVLARVRSARCVPLR